MALPVLGQRGGVGLTNAVTGHVIIYRITRRAGSETPELILLRGPAGGEDF